MSRGLEPARVGLHFLWLGLISFGGPAAHMGYFRREFVERKAWLSDEEFAGLMALCQFLPGPASSQLGFAIGYHRAGLAGAVAAFIGFTLPSFLIMVALAIWVAQTQLPPFMAGVIEGLKLAAVAVVAHAVVGMYQSFCRQTLTTLLAALSAAAMLLFPFAFSQILVLSVAALLGACLLRPEQNDIATEGPDKAPFWPLILFLTCFLGAVIWPGDAGLMGLASDFFAAGSLVFGGGHVVLPLLQGWLGETVSPQAFLTAYAAAQAVPGPMFSMASFLGAHLAPAQPWLGAVVATAAIFLPGFLLLLALQARWQHWRQQQGLAAAIEAVNAAVVGLLIAAWYQPVFTTAVTGPVAMAVVVVVFFCLQARVLPVIALLALSAVAGGILSTAALL